jgi:hypothetical protein
LEIGSVWSKYDCTADMKKHMQLSKENHLC